MELEKSLLIIPLKLNSMFFNFVPNKIFIEKNEVMTVSIKSDKTIIDKIIIDKNLELSMYIDILENILGKNFLSRINQIKYVDMYPSYKYEYYYLNFPNAVISSYLYERICDVLSVNTKKFIFKPNYGSRNIGVFVVNINKLFKLDQQTFINKYKNLYENNDKNNSIELLKDFFVELNAELLFDFDNLADDDIKLLLDCYILRRKGFTIQPYIEGEDLRIIGNYNGRYNILKSPEIINKDELDKTVINIIQHMKKLNIYMPFFTIDFVYQNNKYYLLEIQTGSIINEQYNVNKFLDILMNK